MLILITYDVSTEDADGRKDLEKLQNNVLIMGKEYKILYLNAL